MSSERPQPVTPVVLAAGLGTRMHSAVPKVLHPICGRPMLAYVLDAAVAATGSRPLVVVSPATQAVEAAFADHADFALQAEPRGTADALRAALDALPSAPNDILVLSGDVPLVDPELLRELVTARRKSEAALALVAVRVEEPAGLGRLVRGRDGQVSHIVEVADAAPDELAIDEVNAGLYAFDGAWLARRIADVRPSPVTAELYLPELVPLARADDRAVTAIEVDDEGSLSGVNDRAELAEAELEMRLRINEAHLRAGVTMIDPTTTYVDASVEIAPDVTIEPGVILRGRTSIGRDALIRAGSQILDSRIGERCVIWASVVEASVVESDVTMGPFSHVRSGAHIGAHVQLGNYAEVKNSDLGAGTKSHHFSYLGDADVGEGVNIGAGTITANFDGHDKHRTRIGDHAFIGSDTVLRAPVTVGEGAYTGASSLVTHDVPPGKTVLGVPARLYERSAKGPAEEAKRRPAQPPDLGGEGQAPGAGSPIGPSAAGPPDEHREDPPGR